MNKQLYIVTDDLTGALDTGVQFATHKISVSVFSRPAEKEELTAVESAVVVENLNTRHMSKEDAYKAVYQSVTAALRAGFRYFYKKTDSALRGNIGAELDALLTACGADTLAFVPAFPGIGRTTVNGIQLIEGVPVDQTDFRNDPFNPVPCADVCRLIRMQTDIPAVHVGLTQALPASDAPEILVFDAETEKDLSDVAEKLRQRNKLFCMAGCAGFASVLPEILTFESEPETKLQPPACLLAVCGSLSTVSCAQIAHAGENGFVRFTLDARQRLDSRLVPDETLMSLIAAHNAAKPICIDVCGEYAESSCGMDCAGLVSACLANLVIRLIELGLKATLFVTGGDTLSAVLEAIGCKKIHSMRELYPGIVLAYYECAYGTFPVISKAGSFGNETLLTDLADWLMKL